MQYFSKSQRREHRAAQAADQPDTSMDIDHEAGLAPAHPAEGDLSGADMTTDELDGDDDIAVDGAAEATNTDPGTEFPDMAKIAEALAAVVRETTRENLDALLHVTGHDLDTLLELATNGENNHQASSIVLAASMQRVYRFVDANWQDTMGFRAQVVEANLTCSSEMQNFGFRLAALENVLAKIEGHLAAHPPSTANTAHPGVTPFVIPVPTLLTARVEAVEAKLSNVEETINMAVHRGGGGGRSNNDHEDDMDRILERLRNLGEMRKEAAANKLERAEEEREERLGEMDDNHDELEQRVDIHDEELREVKRVRLVRRLCMYLIAHFTRDFTTDELVVRLRELMQEQA